MIESIISINDFELVVYGYEGFYVCGCVVIKIGEYEIYRYVIFYFLRLK